MTLFVHVDRELCWEPSCGSLPLANALDVTCNGLTDRLTFVQSFLYAGLQALLAHSRHLANDVSHSAAVTAFFGLQTQNRHAVRMA